MNKRIVIKIGGSTRGSDGTIIEDIVALQQSGTLSVVVHGGARIVTDWLDRLGISTRFVNGLRVTDIESLEVVVAVLAGLVNKEIVAAIESAGGRAIGFSGVDGGFIEAEIKDPELGYAGRVVGINLEPLEAILGAGYIPVIAPVSLQQSGKSSKPGKLINVNGDAAAGEIAAAIVAHKIIFLTDVVGICDSSGKLIPYLSPDEAKMLSSSGVITGGMTPKIEACLKAVSNVTVARIVDGRVPHALLRESENIGGGTTIGQDK